MKTTGQIRIELSMLYKHYAFEDLRNDLWPLPLSDSIDLSILTEDQLRERAIGAMMALKRLNNFIKEDVCEN